MDVPRAVGNVFTDLLALRTEEEVVDAELLHCPERDESALSDRNERRDKLKQLTGLFAPRALRSHF